MAMADDQRDVIDFLSRPSSYGAAVERVDIIETHVSRVFLAGDHAYKLKRAIKFPYLDFSSAEQRRIACEAELMLNRRTAPELYLEVRALTRTANGGVSFGTKGRVVDWVVVMRRFDQAALFDELAKTNRLNAPLMNELADHIAAFHQAAEPRPGHGGAAALAAVVETNHCCLTAAPQAGFVTEDIVEIRERSLERLAAIGTLLDRRRGAGKVRRCHGDLHLRNVCLFDGRPTLFDCLEFSDELASVDVLCDLAFLLMDLDHRGLAVFSNLVLNRYLDLTGEDDGLAAMPLFLSSRAAIRAHVTAAAIERAAQSKLKPEMAAEARSYLKLAAQFLQPRSRRLVAIGGLSGTGKSTLAAALAPSLGARVLRSDVIRKRLFEVAPETRLPTSAYTPQVSRRVYQTLRRKAANMLAAGYSVIVDAVSLKLSERQSFVTVAEAAGVPFTGIWLEAPPVTMDRRLRARRHDASDASPEVLARQLQQDPGTIEWVRIDAGGDPKACLSAALRTLGPG
jgi:aminoglycoside phosphotransferase family enzyme/predicted kinase